MFVPKWQEVHSSSFHLIDAFAMRFICYFGCYLVIPATSSMLHLWFLSILFLWDTYCMGSSCHYSCFIPGCLHTSLGLWLACWIISKPAVGHDIVVILWFVKCFVMDCLNWRLIKYWQLWQNTRCFFVFVFGHCEIKQERKGAYNSHNATWPKITYKGKGSTQILCLFEAAILQSRNTLLQVRLVNLNFYSTERKKNIGITYTKSTKSTLMVKLKKGTHIGFQCYFYFIKYFGGKLLFFVNIFL